MKKKRCDKILQKSGMSEPRRCMWEFNHRWPCTPDLTNLNDSFGFKQVLKRGPDYIVFKNGNHSVRWWVLDSYGDKRLVMQASLFHGRSTGKVAKHFSGSGARDKSGKVKSEYNSVLRHLGSILNPTNLNYRSYKKVVVADEWNPQRGVSPLEAFKWVIKNLGPRPSLNHQLHVIKSKEYPFGYFGPGGLVWRSREDRHDQHALDIICDWSPKKWQDFIKQEDCRRKSI